MKKIMPKCLSKYPTCPPSCQYGGWKDGYCGAQHITRDVVECGTYHHPKMIERGIQLSCTVCGEKLLMEWNYPSMPLEGKEII